MIRFLSTALVLVGLTLPAWAADKTKPKTTSTAKADAASCCKDGKCACCAEEKQTAQRVFELRTYYTNEGKLTDLHKRFRDHTCQLLKKHGAELVGFWTPQDDKDGKGSR